MMCVTGLRHKHNMDGQTDHDRRAWTKKTTPAVAFLVLVAALLLGSFRTVTRANTDVVEHPHAAAAASSSSSSLHLHATTPSFLIPPQQQQRRCKDCIKQTVSNMTLREFLQHPDGVHLGMAPSFFGFYGYFGALAAWEEELHINQQNRQTASSSPFLGGTIRSVVGASAGAMAAIMLGAGVSPLRAAEFCTTVTLSHVNDFPGLFSVFRGNKFEEIMVDFLSMASPLESLQLENAVIPVAVSAFDLQRLKGEILSKGSMARAARASATFPGLFQPVGWIDPASGDDFLFIDGGITDVHGLNGLATTATADMTTDSFEVKPRRRIINMVVGDFHLQRVPGPSSMPPGVTADSLVSISIRNLPQCGPWAMTNGPLAVEAARQAMKQSLDVPLYLAGAGEDGHYELHIDASSFVPVA